MSPDGYAAAGEAPAASLGASGAWLATAIDRAAVGGRRASRSRWLRTWPGDVSSRHCADVVLAVEIDVGGGAANFAGGLGSRWSSVALARIGAEVEIGGVDDADVERRALPALRRGPARLDGGGGDQRRASDDLDGLFMVASPVSRAGIPGATL